MSTPASTTDSQVRRYRKRPVEITAIRWLPDDEVAADTVADWLEDLHVVFRIEGQGDAASLVLPTLEGDMRADPGDWIIQGVAGEVYPCKPDIFAATYDPVEAP